MSHVPGEPATSERRYGIEPDTRALNSSVRSIASNQPSPLALFKKNSLPSNSNNWFNFVLSVCVQSSRDRGGRGGSRSSRNRFRWNELSFRRFLHNRKKPNEEVGSITMGKKNNEGLKKKKLSCVNWASMTRWKTCHGCFDSPTILALSSFRGRSFRFSIASCKGKKKEVGMSRWSVIAMKLKR